MSIGHKVTHVAVGGAGAIAAMWALDKFIFRVSDDSPTGFITKAPGFGLDDVVMGVGVAIGVLAAVKLVYRGG